MENEKTIRVTCTGSSNIPLEKFVPLQGKLKTLSPEAAAKLRTSILEHGFSFPILCWTSKEDNHPKHFIVDAHSRIKVLKQLQREGWTIPPLPTVFIEAKDKSEAKTKLLLFNSQYGKITPEGLREFTFDGGDFHFDAQLLQLPDIDLAEFEFHFLPEEEIREKMAGLSQYDDLIDSTGGRETPLPPKTHICPHCGKSFEEEKL